MVGKIIEGPKRKVPTEKKTIGQYFFDQAEKHADKICQVDADNDVKESFKSVKLRSTRVAIELKKRGVTQEDVVMFCSSNILDNVIPLLASLYLGAKVSNLDPSLSVRDINHLATIVEPKMIFVEDDSVGLIEQSLEEAKLEVKIVVLGKSQKHETLADLQKPSEEEALFRPVQVENLKDTGYIFFSSGSTGLPKAICLSHEAFLTHCALAKEYNFQYEAFLHFTTLYWISGAFALIATFLTGGCRVLTKAKFDADRTFQMIEKYKVSLIIGAPGLTYDLTNCPNASKYDTSSLHTLGLGGTPMAPAQLLKVRKLFKHTAVIFAYGMTEAGFLTLFDKDQHKHLIDAKLASCGKLNAGVQMKFVDPSTGDILGPNEKGEILVKTGCLMSGYLKQDSSDVFDKDGFLKTGDIGYYDDDECVYVVDRIKEMFKYKSWHIVPSSLEAVLLEHPDVKEAAVFGIPHEEHGDVPSAAVVLFTNSNKVTCEDIEKFVAERVVDREKLRGGVAIVEELAKTPTGKLVRAQIRENFIKLKS